MLNHIMAPTFEGVGVYDPLPPVPTSLHLPVVFGMRNSIHGSEAEEQQPKGDTRHARGYHFCQKGSVEIAAHRDRTGNPRCPGKETCSRIAQKVP